MKRHLEDNRSWQMLQMLEDVIDIKVFVFLAVTLAHLSVLQRDDTRVFGGADDVVVAVDPLDGLLSKTLDAVSLRGYTHTHTHTHR